MNEKIIYSKTNDPTKWANEDYDVIVFASVEDAKKAEAMFQMLSNETRRLQASPPEAEGEAEHLRMQIGYIATELMIAGDKRRLPEIVETAAKATRPGRSEEKE
jgi:hypothetical protein